jgi:hypothetical protein
MESSIMSTTIPASDVAIYVTASVTVLGVVVAFLNWFRKWVRDQVASPVKGLTHQIYPNGNSKTEKSTREILENLEQDMKETKATSTTALTVAVESLNTSRQALTRIEEICNKTHRNRSEE